MSHPRPRDAGGRLGETQERFGDVERSSRRVEEGDRCTPSVIIGVIAGFGS